MLVSESWLREWVSPNVSTDELSDILTMAGLEVETVTPVTSLGELVLVGEVVAIEKHADADKLNVCEVDVGQSDNLTIVCGAANVAKGIKAPVALVGATLPNGMAIESRAVRGVTSSGMICAASELGLEEQSDGLLLLDTDAPVGTTLDGYLDLDDACIDVDLTPDRGDCLCIAGVAREVAVLTENELTEVEWQDVEVSHPDKISISLNAPSSCAHYVGRIIRNVNLGATSPDWMKEKLRRSGIRSISPIVDVTNYVMLELGQPMHAFDYNKIEGNINVRFADPGELLQLLDEKEITLSSEMLVIADDNKAVALGGIMGGANSEIDDATTDIFLEAAYFSPLGIAGRARELGMQTDASHRFERGVDSMLQRRACERASQLLLEIVGGEAGPICEASNADHLPNSQPINLRGSRINRVLGMDVAASVVESNLARLGFNVEGSDDHWQVTAPSWRFDISGEHDLIEEVGRTVSFDRVEPALPQLRGEPHFEREESVSAHMVRQWVAGADYREVISYSFVSPERQAQIHPSDEVIKVGNPIADNMSVMRTSLWPGLIKTAQTNLNRQHKRIRLFEIGHTFEPDSSSDTGANEVGKLAMLLSGPRSSGGWSNDLTEVDFFDLKGDVENLFAKVEVGVGCTSQLGFEADSIDAFHPGQSAIITLNGTKVGSIGQLHPGIVDELDIEQAVFLAQINLSALSHRKLPAFSAISRFPATSRDLSLVVEESVSASHILKEIQENAGNLLKKVELFDNYRGEKVGEGNVSLAFSLTFQSQEGSLAADHVDSMVDSVLDHLQKKYGVRLRA